MKTLDLDVLSMVVAVTDAGSFVRGAALVHRSQSAVSMQIKALEQALGKPTLRAAARSVVPTQEGLVLADYARRMLALRDEAWASLVQPEVKGRVVIGVPDDYASSLLPLCCASSRQPTRRSRCRSIGLPSHALAPLVRENQVDLGVHDPREGHARRTRAARAERVGGRPRADRLSGASVRYRSPCSERAAWQGKMRSAHSSARGSPTERLTRVRACSGFSAWWKRGLRWRPSARCALPERFVELGRSHGLPPLPPLEVVLARSARSNRPECDFLAEQLLGELRV